MFTQATQCKRFGAQMLPPALALLMLLGAGCSEKETTSTQEAAPAQTPQTAEPEAPQAATESRVAEKPADSRVASVDGQKIYKATCQTCHAAGVANAPKLGDKEAWAPRIAKGNDALFLSVKNGLNVMPPKGTCMSCSEDELRAAIEYMVKQGS